MTPDEYTLKIIDKYVVDIEKAQAAGNTIYPTIQTWAGSYLVKAEFSGSLAKGTAIALSSDADIFISLSSTTKETLQEIYSSLYTYVTKAGYTARKQNVSIGVDVNGRKLDLVPGKRQSQHGNDHSLCRFKAASWTKTNIHTHINHIQNSNRIQEIKLTKIWRELHNLDFPSFYLEMVVIDALKYKSTNDLANNFMAVLNFLANDFTSKTYTDPANSNNTISDDLTLAEKKKIATQANSSKNEKNWGSIVW
ncbi:MAG: hypothetical protein PHZ17_09400 [Sulfurovum sp.]|nr:hypothetical protein [Sulfurovum sp.]